MGNLNARNRPFPARIRTLQFILLVLVSIISYGALVIPQVISPVTSPLQAGEVSPNDFQAPEVRSFISAVRTEEERRKAENAVMPVYDSPDSSVARRQIERLRAALSYITLIRMDNNSSLEQKTNDIAALSDVILQPHTVNQILALAPPRWDAVQQESLSVLEQVMRRRIRDLDMETVISSIPSLVSLSLDEDQASIVSELVAAFITPNSMYSAELTEAAKKSAREKVAPVTQEYKAGESIVSRGQIVTPAQLEALKEFKLIKE